MKKVSRREFFRDLVGRLNLPSAEPRVFRRKDPPENIDLEREIPAVCPGCDRRCGVLLRVRENTLVAFEGDPDHPVNQGFLCDQGLALFQEALLAPGREEQSEKLLWYRPAGTDAWEAKDWGWMLRQVAERIKMAREATLDEVAGGIRGVFILGEGLALNNEELFLLGRFAEAHGIPVVGVDRYPGALIFMDLAGSVSRLTVAEVRTKEKLRGLFLWGGDFLFTEEAVGLCPELEWLVLVDWFKNEKELDLKRERILSLWSGAEVFVLPAAAPWEREGSFLVASRQVQWCVRAVEPAKDARAPLWIIDRLHKAVGSAYQQSGSPAFFRNVKWDYAGERIPDPKLVATAVGEAFSNRLIDEEDDAEAFALFGDPLNGDYWVAGLHRSLNPQDWGFSLGW